MAYTFGADFTSGRKKDQKKKKKENKTYGAGLGINKSYSKSKETYGAGLGISKPSSKTPTKYNYSTSSSKSYGAGLGISKPATNKKKTTDRRETIANKHKGQSVSARTGGYVDRGSAKSYTFRKSDNPDELKRLRSEAAQEEKGSYLLNSANYPATKGVKYENTLEGRQKKENIKNYEIDSKKDTTVTVSNFNSVEDDEKEKKKIATDTSLNRYKGSYVATKRQLEKENVTNKRNWETWINKTDNFSEKTALDYQKAVDKGKGMNLLEINNLGADQNTIRHISYLFGSGKEDLAREGVALIKKMHDAGETLKQKGDEYYKASLRSNKNVANNYLQEASKIQAKIDDKLRRVRTSADDNEITALRKKKSEYEAKAREYNFAADWDQNVSLPQYEMSSDKKSNYFIEEGKKKDRYIPKLNKLSAWDFTQAMSISSDDYNARLAMTQATNEEKELYYYILGKYGKEKARDYVFSIYEQSREYEDGSSFGGVANRFGNFVSENIENSLGENGATVFHGVEAFAAGAQNSIFGLRDAFSRIGGDESVRLDGILNKVYQQNVQSGRIDKTVGDVVYNIGNMMPAVAVSVATAGVASPAVAGALSASVTGLSSFGNTYQQARREGFDSKSATAYAVLNGASEALLQYALNGVGSIAGGFTTDALAEAAETAIKSTALHPVGKFIVGTLAKQAINSSGEFLEEYLQEILDPVFRNWTLGESNEFQPFSSEALYAGILGALSAGAMNSVEVSGGMLNMTIQGRKIKLNMSAEDLVNSSLVLPSTLDAYETAAYFHQRATDEEGVLGENGIKLNDFEAGLLLMQKQVADKIMSEADDFYSNNVGWNGLSDETRAMLVDPRNARFIGTRYRLNINENMTPDQIASVLRNHQAVTEERLGRVSLNALNTDGKPAVKLTASRRNAYNRIQDKTGIDVFFADPEDLKGNKALMIGDRILINKEIADTDEGVIETLVHEITHASELSRFYNSLASSVEKYIERTQPDKTIDDVIREKIAEYKEAGVNLNYQSAYREVVADFAGKTFFKDIQSLLNFVQDDRSTAQRVMDWLGSRIKQTRKNSVEAKLMTRAYNNFRKALNDINNIAASDRLVYQGWLANGGQYSVAQTKKGARYVVLDRELTEEDLEDTGLGEEYVGKKIEDIPEDKFVMTDRAGERVRVSLREKVVENLIRYGLYPEYEVKGGPDSDFADETLEITLQDPQKPEYYTSEGKLLEHRREFDENFNNDLFQNRKLPIIAQLDEIVPNSRWYDWKPDKNWEKHGRLAQNGFEYRRAYVQMGGKYYSVIFSVAKGLDSRGKPSNAIYNFNVNNISEVDRVEIDQHAPNANKGQYSVAFRKDSPRKFDHGSVGKDVDFRENARERAKFKVEKAKLIRDLITETDDGYIEYDTDEILPVVKKLPLEDKFSIVENGAIICKEYSTVDEKMDLYEDFRKSDNSTNLTSFNTIIDLMLDVANGKEKFDPIFEQVLSSGYNIHDPASWFKKFEKIFTGFKNELDEKGYIPAIKLNTISSRMRELLADEMWQVAYSIHPVNIDDLTVESFSLHQMMDGLKSPGPVIVIKNYRGDILFVDNEENFNNRVAAKLIDIAQNKYVFNSDEENDRIYSELIEQLDDPSDITASETAEDIIVAQAFKRGYDMLTYHGTERAGFDEVDPEELDDDRSFFSAGELKTALSYMHGEDDVAYSIKNMQNNRKQNNVIMNVPVEAWDGKMVVDNLEEAWEKYSGEKLIDAERISKKEQADIYKEKASLLVKNLREYSAQTHKFVEEHDMVDKPIMRDVLRIDHQIEMLQKRIDKGFITENNGEKQTRYQIVAFKHAVMDLIDTIGSIDRSFDNAWLSSLSNNPNADVDLDDLDIYVLGSPDIEKIDAEDLTIDEELSLADESAESSYKSYYTDLLGPKRELEHMLVHMPTVITNSFMDISRKYESNNMFRILGMSLSPDGNDTDVSESYVSLDELLLKAKEIELSKRNRRGLYRFATRSEGMLEIPNSAGKSWSSLGYSGDRSLVPESSYYYDNPFDYTRGVSEFAYNTGAKGVFFRQIVDLASARYGPIMSDVFITYNSDQTKSIDPVTYDPETWEIIMPSKRFDDTNPKFQYSVKSSGDKSRTFSKKKPNPRDLIHAERIHKQTMKEDLKSSVDSVAEKAKYLFIDSLGSFEGIDKQIAKIEQADIDKQVAKLNKEIVKYSQKNSPEAAQKVRELQTKIKSLKSRFVGMRTIYNSLNQTRNATAVADFSIGMDSTNQTSYQADINGKPIYRVNSKGETVMCKSLNDIWAPVHERAKSDPNYYIDFQFYLRLLDNADRAKLGHPYLPSYGKRKVQTKNGKYKYETKPMGVKESLRHADKLLETHPEFADLAEEVWAYNHNNLKYLIDAGCRSAEDYKKVLEAHPHYIPGDRDTTMPMGRGKGDLNPLKAAVGKSFTMDFVPVDEAMGAQTRRYIVAGRRNMAMNKVADAWDAYHGKIGMFVSDVTTAPEITEDQKLNEDRIAQLTVEEIEQAFNPDLDDFTNSKNTIVFYRNGKKTNMTVSDGIYNGYRSLTEGMSDFEKTFGAPTRTLGKFFKNFVTNYNPTFIATNFFKDFGDAVFYSQDPLKFLKNFKRAWKQIVKDGEIWQLYKANGGFNSSFFEYGANLSNKKNLFQRAFLDKIEMMNLFVEQAPRLAEFMSTLEIEGMLDSKGNIPKSDVITVDEAGNAMLAKAIDIDTMNKAMFAANDITVNFGRSGIVTKKINRSFVPFLNASVQGAAKIARQFERKGGKAWLNMATKAAILGVLPALVNSLMYKDDDEWKHMTDWNKDNNYMFKLGDGKWLAIPRGRFMSFFASLTNKAVEAANGDDVDWSSLGEIVETNIAPANPLTQNIISPLIRAANNETWFGGSIDTYEDLKKRPEDRYDETTSWLFKSLGKALGQSPKRLQTLFEDYTGFIGDVVVPMTDQKDGQFWDGMANKFVKDSVYSNDYGTTFRNYKDNLSQQVDYEGYSDVWSIKKYKLEYLNTQSKAISEIYDEISNVQSSNLSDSEKKEKTRALRQSINEIYAVAVANAELFEKKLTEYYDVDASLPEDLQKRQARSAYVKTMTDLFGSEAGLKAAGYGDDVIAEIKDRGINLNDYYAYYNAITSGDKYYTLTEGGKTQSYTKNEKKEKLLSIGMPIDSVKKIYKYSIEGDNTSKTMTLDYANKHGVDTETFIKTSVAFDKINNDKSNDDENKSLKKKEWLSKNVGSNKALETLYSIYFESDSTDERNRISYAVQHGVSASSFLKREIQKAGEEGDKSGETTSNMYYEDGKVIEDTSDKYVPGSKLVKAMHNMLNSGYTDKELEYFYQREYGSDDSFIWALQSGMDARTYLEYRENTALITADKDENGKSINGTKKPKIFNAINSMDISRIQKLMLFMRDYTLTTSQYKEVYSYINSLNLSREEKLNLAQNLGFLVEDGKVYMKKAS